MSYSSDEEYTIPLQDKRVFGAGLKRRRIHFVRGAAEVSGSGSGANKRRGPSAAERYLRIVLKHSPKGERQEKIQIQESHVKTSKLKEVTEGHSLGGQPTADAQAALAAGRSDVGEESGWTTELESEPGSAPLPPPRPSSKTSMTATSSSAPTPASAAKLPDLCPICNLPLSSPTNVPHEASFPHQLALPHVHPLSHLDPSSLGVRYLSSYGWDPDARAGLGAQGTGIRAPLKVKEKNDTVGLGVKLLPSENRREKGRGKGGLLDAAQVRKRDAVERKRAEVWRGRIMGDGIVEKYLGSEDGF